MSWELTLMSNWTAAAGVPLENLGPAREGSQLRRELSQRGEATLVLDRELAWHLATPRAIVRIDGVRDGYHEVRVNGRALQTRGVEATRFVVTGLPRIYDLASAGLIYEELGGRRIYTFNEALTPAQYLTRFFLQRQAARGLVGLSARLVAYGEKVPLQWTRWNDGELLDALISATQGELNWVADGEDEFLDLVPFVGADAVTVPLYYGGALRDHQIEEDYSDMGTVGRIAGETPTADSERATIGENLWDVVGLRTLDDDTIAVDVRAPGTTESPILEDGQYAAAPDVGVPARYLQREDGTTRLAILGSLADSSELIVGAGAPLVGERVSIVADATGAPLETLELPGSMRTYGFVERDVQIAGGRGERQYARNGGHEAGLARWSPANDGEGAEYLRTEFGVTLAAQADGARSALTSPATPFAIKGLDPGTNIRQGMELRVGGAICEVQDAAIASTTGVLVLEVSPGLPAPYPDGTPLTLVRRETRTLELDGVQSPLNPVLNFRDVNTDGMRRLEPAASNALTSGDYEGLGEFGYATAPNGSFTARAAGKVGCRLTSLTWSTYDDDVFQLTPTEIVSGSTYSYVMVLKIDPALITAGTVSVGTRLRYTAQLDAPQFYVQGGPFAGTYLTWTVRVTAAAVDTITVQAEIPAGATGVVLGTPATSGGSINDWDATNVTLADGLSWTLVTTKESRPVLLDGAYSLGDTTVTHKPQTSIARRNFTGGDSIELPRTFSAYARLLSGTTALTEVYPGVFLWVLTATIDLAFSTIQDLTPTQLMSWSVQVPMDYGSGGSIPVTCQATDLTGTTLTLRTFITLGSVAFTGPYDTQPDLMTLIESYAVSSATAWDTSARTTLTLSAAIPAGRSYGRGALVWANWHTRAAHGLNTSLRLFADLAAADLTVELLGGDNVTSATTPIASGISTCYRVPDTGSAIPIAGNVLYAAASTVADGSGDASVTLVATNPTAIIDNEAVTIPVPPMVPAGLELTASALRLFCAVGGLGEPLTASDGYAHDLAYVRVPAGATRTITAISLFTLSAGEWFAGQGPALALVDEAGAILGYQRLGDDGLVVDAAPGVVTLTAQATIAQSGLYGFRVFGGSTSDYSRWCVHFRTFFYLGEAADAPYTPTSWPTRLMLAGLRKLDQLRTPRITDRLTIAEWNTAQLQAAGVELAAVPPIVLGGRVHLEEWDRLLRVIDYTERPDMPVADVGIGQLARDGSRIITQTALAAAPQGVR